MLSIILKLIVAAVLAGTPLLFGALGEILTEKSGNTNLGVEGMMYMGAVSGIAGAFFYGKAAGGAPVGVVAVLIALVVSFLIGALGALIYAFLTITLRANQNVTGLTLTIFGTGFGNFFGDFIAKNAGGSLVVTDGVKAMFKGIAIPGLSKIPVLEHYFLIITGWFILQLLLLGNGLVFQTQPRGIKPAGSRGRSGNCRCSRN